MPRKKTANGPKSSFSFETAKLQTRFQVRCLRDRLDQQEVINDLIKQYLNGDIKLSNVA